MLYAGQPAAYTKLYEELRRSEKNDPLAVAARGQLVGDISTSAAVELADRAEQVLSAMRDTDGTELTHGSARKQHMYAKMIYGVNLYVAGWAHLRAGSYELALQRLEESNEVNWLGRGIAHPLIALAYHRLGNAEDALD